MCDEVLEPPAWYACDLDQWQEFGELIPSQESAWPAQTVKTNTAGFVNACARDLNVLDR